MTRHPEQRKVVLSHWRDGLCVASTPVEITEVPALIGLLADAMGDAIEGTARTTRTSRAPGGAARLFEQVTDWLRPRLAQVAELRLTREPGSERKAG